MKCLKLSRENGKENCFLYYGEHGIEEQQNPKELSQTVIDSIVKEITRSDLREMTNGQGETSLQIQMEPHKAAGLNYEKNEDIVILQELEIDWGSLTISIVHLWLVCVRLNPPLVKSVQNY